MPHHQAARRLARDVRDQACDTVLVSAENLPGWRINNLYKLSFASGARIALDDLKTAFAEFDVFWILGTRAAEQHLWSSYRFVSQRKGAKEPFEDWAARTGSTDMLERLVAETVAYLGDRTYVFRMEDEIAAGHPWGHNILSHVGLTPDQLAGLEDVAAENQSAPTDLLPYIKRINGMDLPKDVRQEIVAILRDVHGLRGAASEDRQAQEFATGEADGPSGTDAQPRKMQSIQ